MRECGPIVYDATPSHPGTAFSIKKYGKGVALQLIGPPSCKSGRKFQPLPKSEGTTRKGLKTFVLERAETKGLERLVCSKFDWLICSNFDSG